MRTASHISHFILTTREFTEGPQTAFPKRNGRRQRGALEADFRLVDSLASTMLSVFPYVYLVDAERYENTLIYGTPSPLRRFSSSLKTQQCSIRGPPVVRSRSAPSRLATSDCRRLGGAIHR